jgi:hypothetical protein
MEDEILTQTPPQSSEETIAPVTPIAPATDAPTAPPAESTALERAFQRSKEEIAALKAKTAKLQDQTTKYQGLLEQLQPLLGGGTPGTSSNAAELLTSFSVQEKIEAMKAQAAAEEAARVRAETSSTIAQHRQEADAARQALAAVRQRQALFDFFNQNGGDSAGFNDFCALAGRNLEVDLTGSEAKVVRVKNLDGTPMYDGDQNALDPIGYMLAVRKGTIGSKALQSTLTPYNQSSGVGTSPVGRTPSGKDVYDISRMQELIDTWHKQGKDPYVEIKKADWR